jgi:Domain of unknown function (DUF3458_C) ARM repeats
VHAGDEREAALNEFYEEWKDEARLHLQLQALHLQVHHLPAHADGRMHVTLVRVLTMHRAPLQSLVVLKWLGLQAGSNVPGNVTAITALQDHPAFNINNPNKYVLLRACIGIAVACMSRQNRLLASVSVSLR